MRTKFLSIVGIIGILGIAYSMTARSLVKMSQAQDIQLVVELTQQNPTISRYEIAVAKITIHLESLLGTPYLFGGVDPSTGGVDCSGLLRVASVLAGYPCPRTNTTGIWKTWERIGAAETGAVGVFFRNGRPVHVGYWVNPPEMLHASTSKGVERRDINSQSRYWAKQLEGHRIMPSIAHLREAI